MRQTVHSQMTALHLALGSCTSMQSPFPAKVQMHDLVQAELLDAGGVVPVDAQDWELLQEYDGLLAQGSIAAEGDTLAAAQVA